MATGGGWDCAPDPDDVIDITNTPQSSYHVTINQLSGGGVASGSFVAGTTTSGALGGGWIQPMVGTDTTPQINWCAGGHEVGAELIECIDGEYIAYCTTCNARIKIPKIPGGVSWQQAAMFIARAMSMDEGDSASDLLGELKILEADIAKEERKLVHAKELVALARKTVMKRA